MSLYEFLLFIHIVAVIAWVGGSIGLLIHGMRVMGTTDGPVRVDFLKQADVMGRVFMAAAIVAAAAGIWMVIDSPVWGFDEFFVSFGLAVFIVSAILGMAFYTPRNKAAMAIAEEHGADSPAFEAAGRRIGQVATIEAVLLVAVVWAMVVKPF